MTLPPLLELGQLKDLRRAALEDSTWGSSSYIALLEWLVACRDTILAGRRPFSGQLPGDTVKLQLDGGIATYWIDRSPRMWMEYLEICVSGKRLVRISRSLAAQFSTEPWFLVYE